MTIENYQIETILSKIYNEPVSILASNMLGGGCINHALKVETNVGAFFLKWNANCPSDMFMCEASGLKELKKAANGVLVIPEVICYKDIDETSGFLVLEYLQPGNSGNNDEEQLGRGLAEIHRYRGEYFGFQHNNYCGATVQDNSLSDNWIDFFRDNRLRFLIHLIDKKRGLSSAEKRIYEQLLKRVPELLPYNAVPALIHGDLWSGNYMLTSGGPALIDPATYYADREMEFAIITMFGGFSSRFFAAYNEVFPLDNDWQERNLLYQLYHVLNHYYLFGGGYGAQAVRIAKQYL